MEKGH